ncbi:hypothetical protein ACHAWF_012056 [Thalassiosira exigua]
MGSDRFGVFVREPLGREIAQAVHHTFAGGVAKGMLFSTTSSNATLVPRKRFFPPLASPSSPPSSSLASIAISIMSARFSSIFFALRLLLWARGTRRTLCPVSAVA